MTSLMNGTFRSSCRVWLVTYQGAFVIIRSILDWLQHRRPLSHSWLLPSNGYICHNIVTYTGCGVTDNSMRVRIGYRIYSIWRLNYKWLQLQWTL
jgi:hypothetical protein